MPSALAPQPSSDIRLIVDNGSAEHAFRRVSPSDASLLDAVHDLPAEHQSLVRKLVETMARRARSVQPGPSPERSIKLGALMVLALVL